MSATYDRCPYTLKPLASLPEVNDEHIFPDAIGGVKDFCVRVDAKGNSDLGSKIDAPLIESFLIAGLRMQHGIKSRSGAPRWKMDGVLKDSGRKVQVVFPESGDVEVEIRKPVEMADGGAKGKLVLRPDQRDAFLKQFIENHKKKGRTVIVSAESASRVSEVEIPIAVDLLALKRAMLKIAYLSVYELLGDAFLDDPLIPEWHKGFMSNDPEVARTARIHGVAFDSSQVLNLVLPPLQSYEHAVVVANLQQQGPVVGVALFGTGFHSLVAIASETSHYGLDVGCGKISICDAKAGRTRSIEFSEHLAQTAARMPWLIN